MKDSSLGNNLKKYRSSIFSSSKFSKLNLTIFALIFAALGSYFLFFSHAATIPGDVNGDGTVNSTDLSLLLSNYNTNYSAAEFDGGSIVEAHDISILLAHWNQSSGGGQTSNCFPSPGACGYPDPNYSWTASQNAWGAGGGGVGPVCTSTLISDGKCNTLNTAVLCSALPNTVNTPTYSTANQTIANTYITGNVNINASGITLTNDCINYNGGAVSGSEGIKNTYPFTITDSIVGSGPAGGQPTTGAPYDSTSSMDMNIENYSGDQTVTLSHDYMLDAGENLNTGSWNVSDSYLLNNGMYNTDEHTEVFYIEGNPPGDTITANHNVMFGPVSWDGSGAPLGGLTALLFGTENGNNTGTCTTQWNITNNLMAGSGVLIYECSGASSNGTATLTFTGNDIARCEGSTHTDSQGYLECSDIPAQTGADINRYGDGHGYFPLGALKGNDFYTFCGTSNGTNWTGDFFDDSPSTAVTCQ